MSRYVSRKSNKTSVKTSNTNWNSQSVLSIVILVQKGIDSDPEVSDECAVVGSLDRIKVMYPKYWHKNRSVYSKMINNHISVLLVKNAIIYIDPEITKDLWFVDHLNSKLVCQTTKAILYQP